MADDAALASVIAFNDHLRALAGAGIPVGLGDQKHGLADVLDTAQRDLSVRTSLKQSVSDALAEDRELPAPYRHALTTVYTAEEPNGRPRSVVSQIFGESTIQTELGVQPDTSTPVGRVGLPRPDCDVPVVCAHHNGILRRGTNRPELEHSHAALFEANDGLLDSASSHLAWAFDLVVETRLAIVTIPGSPGHESRWRGSQVCRPAELVARSGNPANRIITTCRWQFRGPGTFSRFRSSRRIGK